MDGLEVVMKLPQIARNGFCQHLFEINFFFFLFFEGLQRRKGGNNILHTHDRPYEIRPLVWRRWAEDGWKIRRVFSTYD